MTALVTLLALAIGLLAVLVVGLLRSHAEVLRALHDRGVSLDPGATRAEGSPPSTRRDVIEGVDLDLRPVAVRVAGDDDDGRTLLAFLSSTCLTCREAWTALGRSDTGLPDDVRAVIVTRGPDAETPSAIRDLAPTRVPTVLSSAAWTAFDVPGAPYAIVLDGRGEVIGQGPIAPWKNAADLVTTNAR